MERCTPQGVYHLQGMSVFHGGEVQQIVYPGRVCVRNLYTGFITIPVCNKYRTRSDSLWMFYYF